MDIKKTTIAVVLTLVIVFLLVLPEITAYDYSTEGTVVSVGEYGIVVEYYNDYGA